MISQILKTISMRKEGMMTKMMMTIMTTTMIMMMMTTMMTMMTTTMTIIGAEVQEAEAEEIEAVVKTGIVREDLVLVAEEVLAVALVEDPVQVLDQGQEEAEDLQDPDLRQDQDQIQDQEDQDQTVEEAQETPIQDRAETVVQKEGVVQAPVQEIAVDQTPVQEAVVALILTPGQEVATEVLIQEGEHQKEVLLQ